MTLCIGWFDGDNIFLASDSRISFSTASNYVDIGIKVVPVPVSVKNPIDDSVYQQILGMCFSGSTTNALILKESIVGILTNSTLNPLTGSISMDSFLTTISKIHEKVSQELSAHLEGAGQIAILVAGYCADQRKLRLFHVSSQKQVDSLKTNFKEILPADRYKAIGSGTKRAEQYLNKFPTKFNSRMAFNALKTTIDDPSLTSIGGPIQAGSFDKINNFKLFNVQHINLDSYGVIIPENYFLAMNTDEFGIEDFIITASMLLPFA